MSVRTTWPVHEAQHLGRTLHSGAQSLWHQKLARDVKEGKDKGIEALKCAVK